MITLSRATKEGDDTNICLTILPTMKKRRKSNIYLKPILRVKGIPGRLAYNDGRRIRSRKVEAKAGV